MSHIKYTNCIGKFRWLPVCLLAWAALMLPRSSFAQDLNRPNIFTAFFGNFSYIEGLADRYAISFLRGRGTYTLVDGRVGEGDLQFRTRRKSVLYVDRKHEIPAAQLRSFTIDGHTLVPRGNFHFSYGIDDYQAENAFIEYADTTGSLQLATYYTAEPGGDWTVYFTTFLLRRRGSPTFAIGPDNNHKWSKQERQRIARFFEPLPEMKEELLSGKVTFGNFPEFLRRANQQISGASGILPAH